MSIVEALQTALAAEHALVHQYALLGGRTRVATEAALRRTLDHAYAAHRGRRDQLTALVLDEGGEPVAALAAYAPPTGLDSPEGVVTTALSLERECARTMAWLVAQVAGDLRGWAIAALRDTAVRALTFRGSPEIFPGAGEYADR